MKSAVRFPCKQKIIFSRCPRYPFASGFRYASLILLSAPVCVMASALTPSGYGTEATFMGGADTAVARDSFAVNTNPAGLSQITGQAFDFHSTTFDSQGTHSDNYGNYRHLQKNQFGTYGNLGYAKHLPDSPYTLGINLVVQGGVGWAYKNLNTVFGGRDEATSLFSIVRLASGGSWKVNDRLSLGASLGLNYANGSQTLFPNTSAAPSPQFPQGFTGINFKDASAFSFSGKFGMQYRPAEDVVIAVTYGTKTRLPLKGGTLRVNYTNVIPGQGIVRYDDAQLKGFALPQDFAIGVSFHPTRRLLMSLQDQWFDYSDALQSSILIAKSPRSAGVPQELRLTSQTGALDQHVYSIGASYEYSDKTTLMAGFMYGRRNIPEQNLGPTFQAIQGTHYMVGLRRKIDAEWTADVGVERLMHQMVTYNNPNLPFGPSVATHTGTPIQFELSRRWD